MLRERTKAEAPAGVTAPVQYGPRAAAMGVYCGTGSSCPGTGRARRWQTCSAAPRPRR